MYLLIGVFPDKKASLNLYNPSTVLAVADCHWVVDRDLGARLLPAILSFLKDRNMVLSDLTGLGVFAGPAAFTDLRVTHVVSNTLAYSLQIPIVNFGGNNWMEVCCRALTRGEDRKIVVPDYGRPPTITRRRK